MEEDKGKKVTISLDVQEIPEPEGVKPQVPNQVGRSRSCIRCRDDCSICITVLVIFMVAITVTIIKICLIDVKNYPELFGKSPTSTSTTTTTPEFK